MDSNYMAPKPQEPKAPESTRPKVRHVTVDEESSGQRLDNFLLRHLKGVPKTRLYRALRKGEVRVNKGRSKADYRIVSGDMIRIPPLQQAETTAPASAPAQPPMSSQSHCLYSQPMHQTS